VVVLVASPAEVNMQRLQISERTDYTKKLESVGINYHTHEDGTPYWYEKAYYSFTESEVSAIEAATNELQRLCIETVGAVIASGDLSNFRIPQEFWPMIAESWDRDEVSIYGRFDLAFSSKHNIKMLEYNADTPTSLLEAAIGQWHWLQDFDNTKDQFNSIHERLIAAWKRAKEFYSIAPIHFMGLDTAEDWQTTTYMRDVAEQAGWETFQLNLLDLGWNPDRRCFTDLDEMAVATAFKLYPWEHMVKEEYGTFLTLEPRPITFLEPAWKMLLSNKAILVELWKRYPNHPNLLPAAFEDSEDLGIRRVKKPIFGREGANVSFVCKTDKGSPEPTAEKLMGEDQGYGEEGFVYQQMFEKIMTPTTEDGKAKAIATVIGAWVIDGEAAGMGIRENVGSFVTDNRSRFVPHLISE
jgi:glutathionylspermidine synthase